MLPDGTDVVVDAGNTGAAAIHHLPVRRGGRFVVALGMGGMGYSFGAGIGMAFGRANRGRPRGRTVVIAGDGAFFMHGMEVHTAVQYRLPVTFVLFNNNAHAMCVTREQLFYDDLYSYNRFAPSQLGAGLARMFPGLSSIDVGDLDELRRSTGRGTGRRRSVRGQRRVRRRRNPAIRTISQCNAPTKQLSNNRSQPEGEPIPMSLPALDDIAVHSGRPSRSTAWSASRPRPREKATPIVHGDDAVGVPARRGLRPVLHRQRLRRLPARRAVRIPGGHPQPRGVDLQPARLHHDRGARPLAGLRPARVRRPRSTPARSPTREARTVDYHCAWDQGKHLWMIYLMRVVDAQVVLDKPGSVVLWTNCRHPFYDDNPYPETAPPAASRSGSATSGTCSAPVIGWN